MHVRFRYTCKYMWRHGDIKLLPSSSASVEGVVVGNLSPIKTSRSNPCNTAFYRLLSVYATLVHTMELAFYRSLSVHATLAHTMGPAFYRSPSVHEEAAGLAAHQHVVIQVSLIVWERYTRTSVTAVNIP